MEGKEVDSLKKLFRVGGKKSSYKPPVQHELWGHFFSGFVDETGAEVEQIKSNPTVHEIPHSISGFRDEAEFPTDSKPSDSKPESRS